MVKVSRRSFLKCAGTGAVLGAAALSGCSGGAAEEAKYRARPHPMAEQPWELELETHIKYVALTRSKDEMHFVSMPEERRDRDLI
jgi:anaerobic selenocysteine-containing dehydrogenase